MKRRAMQAGLCCLIATATAHFLFYNSAEPGLSAVPVYGHVVHRSARPDSHLSFFPGLGKEGDDFSKVWKDCFQGLENRPLVLATVPFGGAGRRETLVAVSELGGSGATALRWRLALFAPTGVSAARPYAVWPVWRFEHPSLPGWAHVRFAITESLMICSISTDSRDIYRLLDAADERARAKKNRRGR